MHSDQYEAFAAEAKYTVLVCGRRWGKSETIVRRLLRWVGDDVKAGVEGVYWIVLPTYALARPLYRKLIRTIPPEWITHTVGTEAKPDLIECGPVRIEFKSAEHPERLVAEGLRGLVVDEGGTVKESAWTESLLPTLIDHDAPALIAGTPKGRNWFHRMYVRGMDPLDTRVRSFGGPSWMNPYVPLRAIQELAADMSQRLFRQEILAEFLEDEGAVFRHVRECLMRDQDGKHSLSKKPTAVIGVDLAKLQDFTVLHGLDKDGNTTFWDRFHQVSWPFQKARISAARKQYGGTVVLDSTGVGDPVKDDLVAAGVPVIGFGFTNKSKLQVIEALSIAIEQKEIGLPDEPVLLNELDIYEYEITRAGNTRYNAPEGMHDDAVIALALAKWGLGRQVPDIGSTHW